MSPAVKAHVDACESCRDHPNAPCNQYYEITSEEAIVSAVRMFGNGKSQDFCDGIRAGLEFHFALQAAMRPQPLCKRLLCPFPAYGAHPRCPHCGAWPKCVRCGKNAVEQSMQPAVQGFSCAPRCKA